MLEASKEVLLFGRIFLQAATPLSLHLDICFFLGRGTRSRGRIGCKKSRLGPDENEVFAWRVTTSRRMRAGDGRLRQADIGDMSHRYGSGPREYQDQRACRCVSMRDKSRQGAKSSNRTVPECRCLWVHVAPYRSIVSQEEMASQGSPRYTALGKSAREANPRLSHLCRRPIADMLTLAYILFLARHTRLALNYCTEYVVSSERRRKMEEEEGEGKESGTLCC